MRLSRRLIKAPLYSFWRRTNKECTALTVGKYARVPGVPESAFFQFYSIERMAAGYVPFRRDACLIRRP